MDNTFLIKLGLNTDALVAGINKSNTLLSGFQNQLQNFGRQIASGIGFVSLSYAIVNTVQRLSDFERQMSEVKALTDNVGLDKLRDNALSLAGAFRALDISKLETEFARLGFSTQEIIDSTQAVINLASATGSDLATSAVTAGSTLRAFGLDAKEMGRLTDVVAGALNRTGLDMSNFTESIKYVAPQARASNITLEETAALLGVLADNGIKGSMAGTTLRRLLQDLATDSRPLIDRLKELSLRGLNAADAMTEVGRIGSTGLLVLTNNVDKIEKVTESLHHVTGEAKAMSDVMQDNLIGDWKKLNAEWDRVIQGNGGGVSTFLREITQNLSDQLKVWNSSDITIWQKIFGGRTDYADYVKQLNEADAAADKFIHKLDLPAQKAGTSFGQTIKSSADSVSSLKKQIEELTKQMDGETSHKAYQYYANQIDVLKTKIDLLVTGLTKAQQAMITLHATAFTNGMQDTNTGVGAGYVKPDAMGMFKDKNGDLMTQSLVQPATDAQKKWDAILKGIHGSWVRFGNQMRQQAVNLGVNFSHDLAGVISGTETMAQAISKMALSVIDSLERMALAYVIENATRIAAASGPAFPFVFAGAIAVGAALLRSAFAGLGANSGSSSTNISSNQIRPANQVAVVQAGQFVIQGRDLVTLMNKNNAYNAYQTG